jgi:ketosteroid isomerase-like protein
MSHPNEELVRRGYEAFATGDVDTMRQVLNPDVLWHAPGRSPLAGDYRGIEEVLGYFGRSMQTTQGTLRVGVEDVMANDRAAAVVQRTTAQRKGVSLDDLGVSVFGIQDGRVVEVWQHWGNPYAADEFLG